jgi:hypothetical protein
MYKDSAQVSFEENTKSSMDTTKLISIVTIIITLSMASERLVEIVKGAIPSLNKEKTDPAAEGKRRMWIQILSVASGITTALLSTPILTGLLKGIFEMSDAKPMNFTIAIIALGLLASGGSALWNPVLEYLLRLKDLKETIAKKEKEIAKKQVEAVGGNPEVIQ